MLHVCKGKKQHFLPAGFYQRTDVAYPTRHRLHTLHTRIYFLVSSNAATCVSESTSRVPMPRHGVLHCVSHLAFTFCMQLGSLRNTSVQTKKNTASSPFDLVSELFVVPTTSHGLETTLRSVSKTQTRFTKKMCQVPEEGWSWLLP